MSDDDTVEVCPYCDEAKLTRLVDGLGQTSSDDPEKWYCHSCGKKCSRPKVREREMSNTVTRGPAAEILGSDIDIMEDSET